MTKRIGIMFGLATAAALFGLAVAWACTPSSSIVLLPETGPAGSTITIAGQVAPDSGLAAPVEIRWNSVSGLLLGTVAPDANRNFSVKVALPEARPGVYYIMAISGRAEAGRAVFQVLSPMGPPPDVRGVESSRSSSADVWSGLSESSSGANVVIAADPIAGNEDEKRSATAGTALLVIGLSGLAIHLLLTGAAKRRRTNSFG